MTKVIRWSAAALLCAAPASGFATLTVSQADPRIAGMALASDGTDYLVVGAPCADGGARLCGTRVSGAGGVVEPAGFTISNGPADEASIAFDGTTYLVVWTGAAGVWFTRLRADGTVLDPAGVQLAPVGRTPAVASNGHGFLVVWGVYRELVWYAPEHRWRPVTSVLQAHVDPGGVAQPTETLAWAYDEGHGTSYVFPLVASDGTGYRVTMEVMGYGTCALTGIDRSVEYYGCQAPMADLASDGASYFMVWDNYDFGNVPSTGVLGARLDSPTALSVLDTESRVLERPALAFDGWSYVAAWQNTRLFATRLRTDGAVLDPGGVLLATAGPFLELRLASCATSSLAIWTGGAALITPQHPAPLGLMPASSPLGGGTLVRLTGAGFEAGATVTVDGQPVADATVEGPDALTFTAPAHAVGAVDLVITNPDGRTGRLDGALTYAGALYLATVIPPRGSEAGGTRVSLLGEGFAPGMTVRFGHRRATAVTVVDDGHAACTTPPGSGTVPVTIAGAGGASSTLRGAYHYDHRRPAHPCQHDRHHGPPGSREAPRHDDGRPVRAPPRG